MSSSEFEPYHETAVEMVLAANLGAPIVESVRNAHTPKELVSALNRVLMSGIQQGALRSDIKTLRDTIKAIWL